MSRTHPLGYPQKTVLTDNSVLDSTVTGPVIDVKIKSVRVANNTGGAVTFKIVDKASTPNIWYPDSSIADDTILNEQFPDGQELFCDGGFDYSAGAVGLDLQIVYYTNPG